LDDVAGFDVAVNHLVMMDKVQDGCGSSKMVSLWYRATGSTKVMDNLEHSGNGVRWQTLVLLQKKKPKLRNRIVSQFL
jgi:hypothetical protein